ncbi:MAG: hypothetical protein GXY44_16825 [Phycisphaerales bacterium]|nr:hypothetical protein [Phycisphaerales bacterium]
MSRFIDANLIASLILEAVRYVAPNGMNVALAGQMKRYTYGLTEYEREEVANMVRFRLATVVRA